MILLDTVVLSELRKTKPNAKVMAYLQAQAEETTFISVLSVAEIEAGIECQRSVNPGLRWNSTNG